jgi:hypothetical protein
VRGKNPASCGLHGRVVRPVPGPGRVRAQEVVLARPDGCHGASAGESLSDPEDALQVLDDRTEVAHPGRDSADAPRRTGDTSGRYAKGRSP